jgi:hypothetical protein
MSSSLRMTNTPWLYSAQASQTTTTHESSKLSLQEQAMPHAPSQHCALCTPSIPSHREPLYSEHTMAPSRVTNMYINEMRKRLKDDGHQNYKGYSLATTPAVEQHSTPLITASLNTTSNASVGGLQGVFPHQPSLQVPPEPPLPNRPFGACNSNLPKCPQLTGFEILTSIPPN